MIEINNENLLGAWLRDASRDTAIFQALDLTSRTAGFASINLNGCVFLGCAMEPALAEQINIQQAVLMPDLAGFPFRTFPGRLYNVDTLYRGFDPRTDQSWDATPDRRAFHWFMSGANTPRGLNIFETLAGRLHDASIERAMNRFLADCDAPVVAVMGGHDVRRDTAVYAEVTAMSRDLRRTGLMIATGGGPGLMEAANLGALLAPYPDDELDRALKILGTAPSFSDHHAWLTTGFAVRDGLLLRCGPDTFREGSSSLGVPTWFYGHEPPNVFASHIAKMFYNSLREDGLITISGGGIIFCEGNAGTVQEIFQDVTQNYYRGAAEPTPMVFYDGGYWTRDPDLPYDPAAIPPDRRKPLLPLIDQLAAEKDFADAVLVSSDRAEIVTFLTRDMPGAHRRLADIRLGACL